MKSLLNDLERLLPGRIIGPDARNYKRYARDMVSAPRLHREPAAVVMIESAEDAAALLRYADEKRIPVTPRGGAADSPGVQSRPPGASWYPPNGWAASSRSTWIIRRRYSNPG